MATREPIGISWVGLNQLEGMKQTMQTHAQEQSMDLFHEPAGEEHSGRSRARRPDSPYDIFMQEQEIPLYRGVGVFDMRELPLEPWKRMGGRGTFIQLDGTDGLAGLYVVEVPAAGVLNPERHIYEEVFYVVEGRGTTEVWRDAGSKKQSFEWQAGSLFAVPLNTWHRLVNAGSSPALVLATTTAPAAINVYRNQRFIFENPFDFTDRYSEADDYYRPVDTIEPDPVWGRAMVRSNLLPDIVNCELPLDNQRSPGYRRIAPHMPATDYRLFIAQHETGRYSKAHYHPAGAVLVCLRGKGYTYTWPVELGTNPWEAGKEQSVKRQDYIPGGLVAAAPGGGNWFHQHFGVAKEPLRILALLGGPDRMARGRSGEDMASMNLPLQEGGQTIDYPDEDPFIRKEFCLTLEREGAEVRMPDRLFQRTR
jgi:quercetin dioxygenase-like cupin family protein